MVGEDITTPVAGEKNTLEVLVCDQFANLCGRGGTQLLVSIEVRISSPIEGTVEDQPECLAVGLVATRMTSRGMECWLPY